MESVSGVLRIQEVLPARFGGCWDQTRAVAALSHVDVMSGRLVLRGVFSVATFFLVFSVCFQCSFACGFLVRCCVVRERESTRAEKRGCELEDVLLSLLSSYFFSLFVDVCMKTHLHDDDNDNRNSRIERARLRLSTTMRSGAVAVLCATMVEDFRVSSCWDGTRTEGSGRGGPVREETAREAADGGGSRSGGTSLHEILGGC